MYIYKLNTQTFGDVQQNITKKTSDAYTITLDKRIKRI